MNLNNITQTIRCPKEWHLTVRRFFADNTKSSCYVVEISMIKEFSLFECELIPNDRFLQRFPADLPDSQVSGRKKRAIRERSSIGERITVRTIVKTARRDHLSHNSRKGEASGDDGVVRHPLSKGGCGLSLLEQRVGWSTWAISCPRANCTRLSNANIVSENVRRRDMFGQRILRP